jgi:predicted DNA-binding transcriptional regulator AlpA
MKTAKLITIKHATPVTGYSEATLKLYSAVMPDFPKPEMIVGNIRLFDPRKLRAWAKRRDAQQSKNPNAVARWGKHRRAAMSGS